jgi:hypothetical protein
MTISAYEILQAPDPDGEMTYVVESDDFVLLAGQAGKCFEWMEDAVESHGLTVDAAGNVVQAVRVFASSWREIERFHQHGGR